MSQASKTLKNIAGSEEYKALAQAVDAGDYEGMFKGYAQISKMLEEAKKQVLGTIQNLPRENKDKEMKSFADAFDRRTGSELPKWDELDKLLKEQKVMEGEVWGVGSKGDPMVRAPSGRLVVLRGGKLEKGTRVRFKVITEGEKLDFGMLMELTPDYFYFLMNRDVRENVKKVFDAVDEAISKHSAADSEPLDLNGLLQKLEEARGIASKLRPAEQEATSMKILEYRKKLLSARVVKAVFDLLSSEEEKEITAILQGEQAKLELALAAPGLLRRQSHQALRARLFDGENLKGMEIIGDMERKLDSMSAAMELMEMKSRIEKVHPSAKSYLEKMDRFFERLSVRARSLAFTIAENKSCSAEDIEAAIKDAFSPAALAAEIRRIFRSGDEFYSLRAALAELRIRLGEENVMAAESAVKPYLVQKINSSLTGVVADHR